MANKLAVTSYSRLVSKYGSPGANAIEQSLSRYTGADGARGITTRLLWVDDPGRTGFAGNGVTAPFPSNPGFPPNETDPGLNAWIQEVNTYCRAVKMVVDDARTEFEFDYLMIVGGNEVFPFFRAPNPVRGVGPDDQDTTVPTDNPYGSPSQNARFDMYSFLIPELPVGRIPDEDNATDPDLLLGLLDLGIKEAEREVNGPAIGPTGWALSAERWQQLSHQVATTNSIPVGQIENSLPVTLASCLTPISTGKALHYFNLHGALDTGIWNGESQGRYPDAIGPAQISGLKLPAGASAVSEACYGADILNRRSALSCSLTFLESGGSGIVGSSTVSFGQSAPPGSCADVIADRFLCEIQGGSSSGASLLAGKQAIGNATTSFGGFTPTDMKTLLQFHLLGDPSHHPMQAQLPNHLEAVALRRQTMRETTETLRGFVSGQVQAKARGVAARTEELPSAAKIWLSDVDRRLGEFRLSGESAETFEILSRALTIGIRGVEPQGVSVVNRLYVDDSPIKVDDPEVRLPKRLYLASAFFVQDRLVGEILVESK